MSTNSSTSPLPPNQTGNTSSLRFPNHKNRTMSLPTRPAPRYLPNVGPKKIENTKAAKDQKENHTPPVHPKSFYMSMFFFFREP